MSNINISWAIVQLETFIQQTQLVDSPSRPGVINRLKKTQATEIDITRQAQVIEQILDRVMANWRSLKQRSTGYPWDHHRFAAIRAKEQLERQEELRKNLGENAPEMSVANLHPWVWEGAGSLWRSGHYRSAVEDALRKVNAETQNKVGRQDVSEAALFQECFSVDAAQVGRARLRRMVADGSESYKSMQRGARTLAEDIYAGIRNPIAHGEPTDIDEQVALEYLAAISILARWVEDALLDKGQR